MKNDYKSLFFSLLNFLKIHAITLLLGVSVFSYIVIKASISSFTHDESFSYLHYISTSFMDIISFKDWFTNNHILNSLLMKYSEKLFGNSEFSLRLPNLLLFIVYLVYSFLLFRKNSKLLIVSIFLLLCTNNALVDFFGLARGYGLSFGFMLMGLYHFIQSYYNQKTKNIILFHTAALLAILSNFTLLDFYLALLLIYNVLSIVDSKIISSEKYHFFNSNKIHIIPLLIIIIILYEPVRRVIMNSNLDFGGKIGFYSDTVESLVNYCIHGYGLSADVWVVAKILFTIILLTPTVIIIRMIIIKDENFFKNQKGLIISNLLFLFISIAIILQHILFKADYPIARFSLFLLPLYIIHFGFILSYISSYYKKTVTILAMSLALISSASFVLKADLYLCSEWKYDMETKNMIQKLTEYHSKNSTDTAKIKLGIDWIFEPAINFYIQTKDVKWLLPADRNGISVNDDYCYVFSESFKLMDSNRYIVVAEFKKANTVLLKNKK
jgi:hypothetical protein